MSKHAPQKTFGKTTENLANCRLTSPLTDEQALAIAEMLSISEPWKTLKFSAAALAKYLMRDDTSLYRYAVSVDGKLAGVICVRYPWLRGPYIELLGLSQDHRGQGIGKQILAWTESEARREARNLWVVASSFNHQALDFYQGLGFQPIGPIQGLVTPEYDEILLRKCLD
ncbi:GCN5-related N-acetyltransferase [Sideroxydans lithotrophicus ES-1]|uniref:GCN5-related N-acetyltransferase n=2 Tax=Sideroxydans TaxID=314343 RepID=D5CNP2_SIDLE|nr:GCN5-related N-acetyltransferase [Sideroxydans lithotrophicus ES-1]